MAWAASLATLAVFYGYFAGALEVRDDPNRALEVGPSGGFLSLKRNRQGHYVFPGAINGRPVRLLLDTGATLVTVPAHLADELGLEAGASQRSQTANGVLLTRGTRLDTLAFGPFRFHGVAASLNPGMSGGQVLLGMSALKRLEFAQRGDTLILTAAEGD